MARSEIANLSPEREIKHLTLSFKVSLSCGFYDSAYFILFALIMTQIPAASDSSRLPSIQVKTLYPLPTRFYGYQLFILVALALLFSWLSRDETLDRIITGYWYDAATQRFPLQHNALLDLLNHRLAKYITIALAVMTLLCGLVRRQPRLVTGALLMALGALVVGVLKSISHHSCPWDLVEYGGHAVGYPLFSAAPAQSGPGRCFPGGHASSGFMVMGLFFAFWRDRPRLAWSFVALGVVLGLAMGYGQVMRGAHFFSHNLWAGWWVWFSQVVAYGLISAWLAKE